MNFVFPGDRALLTKSIGQDLEKSEASHPQSHNNTSRKLKLGPGILRSGDEFNPIYPGILRSKGNKFWLDYDWKRYFPVAGDRVIGQVISVHSEHYKVDIGYHVYALLDVLAFEGASKRNRPQLNPGSLIYAKVSRANPDIEPEITCIAQENGKADGLGELVGGYHLRALSQQKVSFDLVVGMNGLIWVRGKTLEQTHYLAYVMQMLKYSTNDKDFVGEMQKAKVILSQ